ncbi:MAG: hypothetical protein Q9180_005058 [Flavoplaca navasiana]
METIFCQAAIAARGNIEEPKPEDPAEGQEWDRQARLVKAIFNIDANPAAPITDRTMRNRFEASFPQGAFVWKKFDRWETGELAIPEPVEDPDPEEYLCTPDGQAVSAFVHRFAEMVVWCETGLRRTPLLGNDVSDANTRVTAGDGLPYAMSTTWMHELMHVWPENPYVDDLPRARQDTSGIVTRTKENTYGFEECANLAKLVPDDAMKNADNYQIFATAAMVDWTHSFIRNASTLPDKYRDIMGPYQTPNTTLLGFRIPPEQLTAQILDIPEKPLRVITDTTPEGKALLEFLLPITKEPEYDYITWGAARELADCLFILIGKTSQRPHSSPSSNHVDVSTGWWQHPPTKFTSPESWTQLLQSSPLASASPNLRNPFQAMNINFNNALYPSLGNHRELSCELLTWVIPPHLDPTYHQNRATQFDELGTYLTRSASRSANFKPRDILDISRGWGSNLQMDEANPRATCSAREPSQKTHLFFIIWADAEKERKWKDGTSTDAFYVSWDENFMKLQREWEGMGMRTESLHLSLEDFEEQLIWRKCEAEKAKQGFNNGKRA